MRRGRRDDARPDSDQHGMGWQAERGLERRVITQNGMARLGWVQLRSAGEVGRRGWRWLVAVGRGFGKHGRRGWSELERTGITRPGWAGRDEAMERSAGLAGTIAVGIDRVRQVLQVTACFGRYGRGMDRQACRGWNSARLDPAGKGAAGLEGKGQDGKRGTGRDGSWSCRRGAEGADGWERLVLAGTASTGAFRLVTEGSGRQGGGRRAKARKARIGQDRKCRHGMACNGMQG